MQKSFVVKATLCIEDCQFYLRAGDVLMFESAAQRLSVYRANDLIKTLKQTPLGIAAMLKTGILQETTPAPAAQVVAAAPTKPAQAVAAAAGAKPKADSKPVEKKQVYRDRPKAEPMPVPVKVEKTPEQIV